MAWAHGGASRGEDRVNIGAIANRLRRYFAPVSTLQAPLSGRTMTGNRNVSISAGLSPNNAPDDSGIAQLINGVAVVSFKTKFGNQPVVTAHPIGAPSSGAGSGQAGPALFNDALGYRSGTAPPQGAIIKSTDTTDTRYIFWHAVENFD
jgi:hypothetical protein